MAIVVGVSSTGSSIGNYSGLIQSIIDTLKDETLEDFIPDMIFRAEALFSRILYPLNDETSATVTTTADTGTSSLPTDIKRIRTLYKGTDTKAVLPQMSLDDLKRKYLEASNAQPEAFATATDQIHWGPIPDDAYSFTCVYVEALTNLSQAVQTNWLIENHPDVYYFGTLMYAELFGWNDERSQSFAETTMEILHQINRWDVHRRFGYNHETVTGTYF
jgi:hypothetical protein